MTGDSEEVLRDGDTGLRIEGTFVPCLNLALYQNAVPALRELSVVNVGAEILRDGDLLLLSSPPIFQPRTWRLDEVRPGERGRITDLDLELDGGRLAGMTEAESAVVSAELRCGGEVIARQTWSVELLARNQWGGIGHLPEVVAAFVQPNDPAVDRVLRLAADVLLSHGRDGGLNGYQGGRQAAWEIVSAVWTALGSLGLAYALPPASFETSGQKIRSPSQVLDGGVGTCLDLAVLVAAVLEQAGLNPLLVFTEGHALPGVWLRPEHFTTSSVDDVTALRKRIFLEEMVLFETTLLTARPPRPPFGHAVERGAMEVGEAGRRFGVAIDVRRARAQRIRPMSSGDCAVPHAPAVSKALAAHGSLPFEPAPSLPDDDGMQGGEDAPRTPADRLERWQRRLLDLSLRNNLLNFRAGKRSIPVHVPDPARFEDLLAEGRAFKVLPRPELMEGIDPRSAAVHEARTLEDIQRAHANESLDRGEILAILSQDELEKRLVELYRHANATLQETGSNTLFLALGFLSWTRDKKDGRRYRAPLVLVPVTLTRKTVRTGFKLSGHDDEPQINPTLLEMLRKDFELAIPAVAGELPKDESGLDLRAIWNAFAQAIKDFAGWEVVEDVALAPFSFGKYLMWKDLVERIDALRQSGMVRHLLDTPRDPYEGAVGFPEPSELDRTLEPEATFCPLPADSSQLAAVVAAARGKDFVLVGPPGTGKSQTIANIIAQCLAEEKTVLFVCEKAAALEVVSRRLRQVGLGEFCLELHSHKARKVDVIERLRSAWEARGNDEAGAWRAEAGRIGVLRNQLNRFVERMHHRWGNGLTVFRAMGTFVAGRDIPPVGLTWPAADSHDIPALERLRDLVRSLRVHAEEVADLVGGPLRCVARVEWSSRWQDDVVRSAEALMRGAGALTEAAAAFVQKGGLPPTVFDGRRVAGLRSLAAVLPRAAGKDWRFMLRPDAVRVVADLGRGSALVQQHTEVAARLSVPYRPAATELDLSRLRASWRDAAASWWPMSYFRRRPVRAALIGVSLGERPFDVASDLDRLTELQSLESDMEQLSHLAARTEGLWEGLGTSADEASAAIAFHRDLTDALAVLATDGDTLATFHGALERLLGQGNALLGPNGEVAAAASALEDAAASNDRSVDGFTSLASTTREDLLALTDGTLADLAVLCEGVINDARHLHRWCAWRKVRSDALVVGLGPLLDALESGVVPSAALAEAFDVAYCRWWLGEVVDQDDLLRTFLSAEHERLIEDFRRADARFMELTGAIIRARLCADMPVQEGVKKSSEWGVLRRELEKKRRHLPVRELISRMPTAFPKLAPCLLMSPLSIAQYLSAETATFDVVIFDEASQIPVWDAIGAIARGRQVVMVGDPKQLPPTNFFQRGEEEPDSEVDEDGDLESILDECLGANVPTSRLSWHYRSRHESLIAFSNHRYYDGGLVTFPSPQTRDRAVRLQFVEEGVYGRGGPRTNLPEARALVSEIVARLRDPEFVASGFTVGIVTFNAEQQGLIQDLLDEERRKDPSIEGFFSESLLEPLFVKNLENVQGDERDVILFSVTYGPDAAGVVSVNFGPLNKDGGERRLNVAVTRARHELLVFASLHPEQIDLSRTQARGVSDFKHFLEFAEKGPRALVEAVIGSQGDFESPFEQAVSKALAGRGWQVNPQVGVSSFRIDLAVVDPDSPGRYLAGIECDGATYHRSATARDRDKIREQVLRGLGWEILRIWSTDWWHDAEGALDRVHGRLQALLEATRARVEETPGVEASARVADGEPLGVREGVADDRVTEALPEVVADRPAAPDEAPSDEAPSDEAPSDEAPSDEAPSDEAPSDQAPSDQAPSDQAPSDQATPPAFFTEADPLSVVPEVDAQAFDHAVYDSVLALMITHVIDVEGPIRDDVLARRIARAHGWQRTGSRIRERVLTLARTLRETTSEDVGVFHWPAGTDPLLPMRFRPPQPGASRSVDEVALPELEALARTILAHRLDRYQSIRLMAGDLGMRSVSRPARLRLSLAYQRVSQPPRSAT